MNVESQKIPEGWEPPKMGLGETTATLEDRFELIKVIKTPCRCDTPNKEEIERLGLYMGTIIKCRKCDQKYSLRNEQRDGWYWEKIY